MPGMWSAGVKAPQLSMPGAPIEPEWNNSENASLLRIDMASDDVRHMLQSIRLLQDPFKGEREEKERRVAAGVAINNFYWRTVERVEEKLQRKEQRQKNLAKKLLERRNIAAAIIQTFYWRIVERTEEKLQNKENREAKILNRYATRINKTVRMYLYGKRVARIERRKKMIKQIQEERVRDTIIFQEEQKREKRLRKLEQDARMAAMAQTRFDKITPARQQAEQFAGPAANSPVSSSRSISPNAHQNSSSVHRFPSPGTCSPLDESALTPLPSSGIGGTFITDQRTTQLHDEHRIQSDGAGHSEITGIVVESSWQARSRSPGKGRMHDRGNALTMRSGSNSSDDKDTRGRGGRSSPVFERLAVQQTQSRSLSQDRKQSVDSQEPVEQIASPSTTDEARYLRDALAERATERLLARSPESSPVVQAESRHNQVQQNKQQLALERSERAQQRVQRQIARQARAAQKRAQLGPEVRDQEKILPLQAYIAKDRQQTFASSSGPARPSRSIPSSKPLRPSSHDSNVSISSSRRPDSMPRSSAPRKISRQSHQQPAVATPNSAITTTMASKSAPIGNFERALQRTEKALEAAKLLTIDSEMNAEYAHLERVRGQMDHVLKVYEGVYSDGDGEGGEGAWQRPLNSEDDVQSVIERALSRVRGVLGEEKSASPISGHQAPKLNNQRSKPKKSAPRHQRPPREHQQPQDSRDDSDPTFLLLDPSMMSSPRQPGIYHNSPGTTNIPNPATDGYNHGPLLQQISQHPVQRVPLVRKPIPAQRQISFPQSNPAVVRAPQNEGRFQKYNPQTGLFDLSPSDVRSVKLETYAARRAERAAKEAQEKAEVRANYEAAMKSRQEMLDKEAMDQRAWRGFRNGVGGHGTSFTDPALIPTPARPPHTRPSIGVSNARQRHIQDFGPSRYAPQPQQQMAVGAGWAMGEAVQSPFETALQQQLNQLKWRQMQQMKVIQAQQQHQNPASQ